VARRGAFHQLVDQATQGTPYVVTPTDDGFDVTLDIVDEQWFGLFHREALKRVYTHHVAVRDDDTYSVTDDSRTVEWQAGIPRLSGSVERTRGRVKELSAEKIWAIDEHGTIGKVVDYSFSSETGRGVIRAAADQLGLRERRGLEERIGIAFAVLGGVGALITLVVLGATELLG
jgi:hypothetical protein